MKLFLNFCVLTCLFILSSCTCDSQNYEYNEKENMLINKDGNKYYMCFDNWKLEGEGKLIGETLYKNKKYQLFADENIRYIQMKRKYFNDKALCLFINEKIILPSISEIKNYQVVYNKEIYNYNILQYYFKSSNITELETPYEVIEVNLKIEYLEGILYSINLYKVQNDKMYIQNNEKKYVEILNFI